MPRPRTRTPENASDIKPFREVRATELDERILKEHLATYGYALIRNLLFPRDVGLLLTEITQTLSAARWLDPARLPRDRIANPGVTFNDAKPAFRRVSDQVFNLETFHAVPHHPVLRHMMELLVGPRLLVHPRPIPRLVAPSAERFHPVPHQDHQAIAGDPQTFTAWIPLHDCPPKLGPIRILEGSHRRGLQGTSSAACVIPIDSARDDAWVGARINAGDVLVFHSLTMHTATPNTSTQFRISLDCRFQSYDRPINPANLVFPGGEKSWETTYSNWRSNTLKYYWKKLPLQFKPSLADLELLAQTADSPDARARYTRILTQLQQQP